MKEKTKIAIFASGGGSNAKAIIDYSFDSNYEVNLLVSNKEKAGVLKYSEENNIDALVIDREGFYYSEEIIEFLVERDIEVIILAGFLWLIPEYFIQKFEGNILNIHPSLLPKYGGKGMYGINVHQAVFDTKEKESGITIHIVNQEYDKGTFLLQKKVDISQENSPKEIAEKVLKLEHQFYPQTIENFISKRSN